jgi:DNA (cytosine-5)-methyltransferase 1
MIANTEYLNSGCSMKKQSSARNKGIRLVASEPPVKPYFTPLSSIDLFCGAGGITQGFRQVGYNCLYANDFMPEAIETFRHNHPSTLAECKSIEEVNATSLRKKLGIQKGELDVLVGGPPCQGFSINAPSRFLADPRNSLFKHYARFVEEFAPKTFVFENVPGLLSMADGAIFEKILQVFSELGYHLSVKILFGPHYGIPQERWRLILLGSQFGEITHPAPTHYAKGRANFRGGSTLTIPLNPNDAKYLLPAVNVGDAIRDLPKLSMGEGAEEVGYTADPESSYALRLRNPDGIAFNHVAAKLSKQNIERMSHVPPGGSWRDIPHELLPRGMQQARKSDHTKRYGRLSFEGLSGTVLTKCDPHWGTVFLPDQDRTLSVREAARLQSFPDQYRFLGSRVSQYVQVGNAVPVLMASAIAKAVREHLAENTRVNSLVANG